MPTGEKSDPGPACLSVAYLGPVSYFTKFLLHGQIIIDVFEHYQKQSYRNRCVICSANGPLALSIPVLRGPAHKNPVKDVRIDSGKSWQKQHMKSLESAYRSAPFYEFYIDAIMPFLEKDYRYLADLDFGLQEALLDILGLDPKVRMSGSYLEVSRGKMTDYRERIHPKKEATAIPCFNPVPYVQVFEERFGFIPDLSIADLLFNAGPDAVEILKKSIVSREPQRHT